MLKKIKNIRVVGIAPGYTKTPMLENMNQTILEKLIKDVHLSRLEPSEIATLIEHIIESKPINGTTIEITGGLCHQVVLLNRNHAGKIELLRSKTNDYSVLIVWLR